MEMKSDPQIETESSSMVVVDKSLSFLEKKYHNETLEASESGPCQSQPIPNGGEDKSGINLGPAAEQGDVTATKTDKTSSDTDSATISNTPSQESMNNDGGDGDIDNDQDSPASSSSNSDQNPSPTYRNRTVIEIVEVSEGENVLIHTRRCSSSSSEEKMEIDLDVDEVGQDVVVTFSEPAGSTSVPTTPGQGQGRSVDATPSTSSSAKKSNLRKVSKYENLSTSQSFNYSFSSCNISTCNTPTTRGLLDEGEGPTPRKRIRIVEEKKDKDICQGEEGDSSGDSDLFGGGVDLDLISGHTFQTNYGGQEIVWVSPPPAPLDFTFIHEDVVRAARVPVTKKFSVEIDMHFVDGETIGNLMECKPLIITAGFFNFEQVCRQETHCPGDESTKNSYIYYENASNLKSLDEGLNFDLIFSKELLDKETEDGEKNIFYFADIWNTSKGFREYILRKSTEHLREGLMTKGFAIQDSDGCRSKDFNSECGLLFSSFKTQKYTKDSELGEASLPVELVDHFSLEDNRSSDICEITVSDEFIKNILSKTDSKGVHLLVADNPSWINIHEYVREVRFHRQFYAQCIIALLGVREGGTFIVKIFDAITLFSAGLIFLMHRCFRSISIHKPPSSRAHTSERFLICTGKLSNETSDDILQFLLLCHNIVMKHEEVRRIVRKKARRRMGIQLFEVKQLVPLKVIIGHADFFEFLRLQNIRFTKSLVANIQELCGSIPEQGCTWMLNDPVKVRKLRCLAAREDKRLEENSSSSIEKHLVSMFKKFGVELNAVIQSGIPLNKELLSEISKSRNEWVVYAMQDCKAVMGAHPISLFLGIGGDSIFYVTESSFKPIRVEGLSLTKGTLLLATIVELIPMRLLDKDDEQVQISSIRLEFHILDGIFLSGQYIGDLPYSKRIQLCDTYARVMNKCKDFENLKCTVIKTREPLVLRKEKETAALSTWINSRVYVKENVCHYPGSLRLVNFPQPDSPSAMSVGGMLFYRTAGNLMENIKKRVEWVWGTNNAQEGGSTVVVEDFIRLSI